MQAEYARRIRPRVEARAQVTALLALSRTADPSYCLAIPANEEPLGRDLSVMDRTAFGPCQEPQLPIVVLDLHLEDNLLYFARLDDVGTRIHRGGFSV